MDLHMDLQKVFFIEIAVDLTVLGDKKITLHF